MKAICGGRRCRIEIGDQLYHIDDIIGGCAHTRNCCHIMVNSDVHFGNQWPREINLYHDPSKSALGEQLSRLIKQLARSVIRSRDSNVHKAGDKSPTIGYR